MTVTRHGPSIGTYKGRSMPAYIITDDGRRHNFHRTAVEDADGGVHLSQLGENETVISGVHQSLSLAGDDRDDWG